MDTLVKLLFQNDVLLTSNLTNSVVLPNLMEGIDIREGNGDVLLSSMPDVFGMGEVFTNGLGEKVAHVSENIMGGTKIDLGGGDVINGTPNIYGGENFYNLEGFIGFTSTSLDGDTDFISPMGDKVMSFSEGSIAGTTISTPLTVDIPFDTFGFSSVDGLSNVTDINNFSDVNEMLDFVDTAGGLSDILGVFF